jgi:hypothetical protein
MKLARSTFYYRSHRDIAEKLKLRDLIISLCAEFPRYGYGASLPICVTKE